MKTARREFELLAEAAMRAIPLQWRKLIVNLEISVKARPGPEAGRWRGSSMLLGLYTGLRRSDMTGPYAGAHGPARIILYQRNIEDRCPDEAELAKRIRTTLRHELAHHFGFTDQDLGKKWPEGA